MTEPTQMVKKLFDSLPDECPVTMEHVQVHLDCLADDISSGDNEQAAHDADIAGTLLICLGSKLRGEKWTP